MTGIVPWIILAFIVLVVVRMVIGAVKTSAKILLWLVIAIGLAVGFLWYKNRHGVETPSAPSSGFHQQSLAVNTVLRIGLPSNAELTAPRCDI